jgi:adenosylcobinamide-phosphate synthase
VPVTATTAVALAAVLDATVAEPPARVHPVALFGRVVEGLDRDRAHPRLAGFVLAVGLPLGAAGLAGGVVALAALVSPWPAAVVAGLVLFAATSLRMLLSTAASVLTASEGDLDAARHRLPALAGRDPATLSPGELRSAAVESLAENLADGLVAPLLAFALGALVALPVAAAAAAWVKAVDTLDSMLGYRDRPLGWASARLDDLAMAVPARLTACLVGVAAGRPGAVWRARTAARTPPSPNSGWPMATLAAAHDVSLCKPGAYAIEVADDLPDVAAGRRATRTVGLAGGLAFVLAGVTAWF